MIGTFSPSVTSLCFVSRLCRCMLNSQMQRPCLGFPLVDTPGGEVGRRCGRTFPHKGKATSASIRWHLGRITRWRSSPKERMGSMHGFFAMFVRVFGCLLRPFGAGRFSGTRCHSVDLRTMHAPCDGSATGSLSAPAGGGRHWGFTSAVTLPSSHPAPCAHAPTTTYWSVVQPFADSLQRNGDAHTTLAMCHAFIFAQPWQPEHHTPAPRARCGRQPQWLKGKGPFLYVSCHDPDAVLRNRMYSALMFRSGYDIDFGPHTRTHANHHSPTANRCQPPPTANHQSPQPWLNM